MAALELIDGWLQKSLDPAALSWLHEKSKLFASGTAGNGVFTAFSTALRHAGKGPLELSPADLRAAEAVVEGWRPSDWTLDEAARIYLLLSLPAGAGSAKIIDQMYETADVGEATALQKALPLLPIPELHLPRAREAVRSNIKLVFEAMALRNPYPARNFDDTGWNQMIVKTFFIDSPLGEVWGLDYRRNALLRQMLVDLAYERWAAGRAFSPMLWRCVGPLADSKALGALEKALGSGNAPDRRAAALALKSCPLPEAARILASDAELSAAVAAGKITWENYDRP